MGDYNHTHCDESEEEYDSDDIDQFISGKNINNDYFNEEEQEQEQEEKEKEKGDSEEELPSSGTKRKRSPEGTSPGRRLSGGLSGDEEPHMDEYLRFDCYFCFLTPI